MRLIGIWIFLLFCVGSVYGQNSPCELPGQLHRVVTDQWKGWTLLQVSDLVADDQALWQKSRGSACPGFASGHFVDPDRLSYAFSLINRKSKEQQVILAIPANGGFSTRILDAPSYVARFSVIYSLPPGKYVEVESGRTARTKLDSIAYETIEAGEIMFYEERGSFRKLLLSE